MKDVQNERDFRNIPIDKVGVSGVQYPIIVLDPEFKEQHTVAEVSMSVSLPETSRGTHMSRFIGMLNEYQGRITLAGMQTMTDLLRQKLRAEKAEIVFSFPYFIKRRAPVSQVESFSKYDVRFQSKSDGNDFDFVLEVKVPVQTLCPCSREISEAGAHNQRAVVDISIRMNSLVWIEELADIAETCASAPVFTFLKREDEKFITEKAYNNPRFVEDVAREVVLMLKKNDRITWYHVSVASNESIHNHDAFAEIEKEI